MARNISKKQAGVIYGNWKRGNISATKETMSSVYSYAEHFVTTDSKVEELVDELRACIDAIFSHDYEKAQEAIDRFVMLGNRYYTAA